MNMSDAILCIDDEPAVLAGFRRTLAKQFALHTAESGAAGLAKIAADGPFAVVVADMSMPGMNGLTFLSEVQRVSPDTVRIMLTGHTNHKIAIAAINEAQIFRYLVKPCDTELLSQALQDGIYQHRLVVAERELLENTLGVSQDGIYQHRLVVAGRELLKNTVGAIDDEATVHAGHPHVRDDHRGSRKPREESQ